MSRPPRGLATRRKLTSRLGVRLAADRQVSAGGRRRQRPRFVPSSGRRRTDRGGTMGQLATGLLSLSGWAALALLFMLPALEAPAFLGLVLPGELALLLGGVLAHQDRIPLVAALAVGVAGAVAGDTAGYWIGRHWAWSLAAAPPAPGSCSPAWPACSGCATRPSPSGPARPRPSGRSPMSCSAMPPVPAGAISTNSPAGSASPSPEPCWS